jgi:hypothetical protein
LIKSSYGAGTCVVDEYVEFSPMSINPLTDRVSVMWVGKITGERLKRSRALAALLLQVLQSIFPSRGREHMCPALDEHFAEGSTDPAGAAGDEHPGMDQ